MWNNGYLGGLGAAPTTSVTDCELAVPLSLLGAGTTAVRLLLLDDEVTDAAPDAGFIEYTLAK